MIEVRITLPDFKIYSVKAKKNYWHYAVEDYKLRHPKQLRKPKYPGLNVEETYQAITDLAIKLKNETSSRKEFAIEVERRGLTRLLFCAYDGKLTKDDIIGIADISKIGSLARYK